MDMEHDHNQHDDKHSGHSIAMFCDKFWLCLILTIPVIIYSSIIQNWLKFTPPVFVGSKYIPFIFSTIIFFYGGLVFIKGAWREFMTKSPGMMTLISLAITTSYIYSIATLFFISGDGFFWELATLITIMLLGHWLEMSSVQKASNALDAIKKLLPDMAEKIVNGMPQQASVSDLVLGDVVLVRPGTNIPVDGVIIDGISSVNESAITGESKSVNKIIGNEVVAGTINQDGSLKVKITKLGDDTMLAGIMRLVDEAQNSKSNVQILADRAAFALTIIALATSIITFVVWLMLKDAGFAIERAVTVLIIACPHALGLAIPLVVSISTSLSARNGLLIRKRLALESARKIDVILFDKTGTLTKGKYGISNIWASDGYTDKNILRLTASLEQNSEHVIGKGIVNEANKRKINIDKVRNFTALPGLGVKGILNDNKLYIAASHRYIEETNINIPINIADKIKQSSSDGKTEVYLILDGVVIGAITLADVIKDEAKSTIANLKAFGIKTGMITGDSEGVASNVAKQLGIDWYYAKVRPQDKADKIKDLQKQGYKVAMVGDGINDAPALARADIGIAIGAGTDIAIKSAYIILVKSDLRDVIKIIKLSKATYSKMIQNLIWATGYNVIAIPLAAGVLSGFNIILSPAIGAVFMSASTIIVALNAQLLRRTKLS